MVRAGETPALPVKNLKPEALAASKVAPPKDGW
jgi:hypothetical protein